MGREQSPEMADSDDVIDDNRDISKSASRETASQINWLPHFGHLIATLPRRLLDTALPPRCPACRALVSTADALCAQCWRGISFVMPPICARLGLPMPTGTPEGSLSAAAIAAPPAYDRARAAALYDGTMRRLVHQVKYSDRHESRRLLARLLAQASGDLLAEADVIVPVPLSRLRLIGRRFNQAAIVALEVGRLTGLPVASLVLERRRHTPSQVGLSAAGRRDNVAGAFRVAKRRRHEIEGLRVLLIDDVITTGSTVEAAARALLRGGAAAVDVATLAIVDAPRQV